MRDMAHGARGITALLGLLLVVVARPGLAEAPDLGPDLADVTDVADVADLAAASDEAPPAPDPEDLPPGSPPAAPAVTASQPPPPAAGPAPAPGLPYNVILLVVDSWRDELAWNGYPRETMPVLRDWRSRSVSYARGYAVSSVTSKSVPAMLTGQYPSSLPRSTIYFTRYPARVQMMAEVLQQAGVRTLGVQAHKYLERDSGLHQGFDEWRMVPGLEWNPTSDPLITAPDHTRLAQELLSRPENTDGPFFAYFHYMDPHDLYNRHKEAPQWGRKVRDRYDQELFFTDLWIGKLLSFIEQQPWAARTAILVTGDHGEAFGEHGMTRHGFALWEVLVRVPLFVYLPGTPPRELDRWRSHIDLAPTIYELLQVPAPPGLPGTSLVAELIGDLAPPRPIFCDLPADTLVMRHRALIAEDGYKLIAFGQDVRYELYDVRRDPGELRNLFRRERDRARALVGRYKDLGAAIPFVAPVGSKPPRPD
ncbi:MAG: sulfatase [Myxococcota bacterium]|jgi:arylsulfatase A-like enzyme|nr:sulfatase [Myxococcota bacterium]